MTSPVFNQFTSVVLHIVLDLIIYGFLRAFEFIFYIGNFKADKEYVKSIFHQLFFLMVRNILNIIYLSQKDTLRTLLNSVVSVKKMNEKITI